MQVVAVNGLSHKVSVVQKDIALLERGHEVRYLGCNLAIADLFDAGNLYPPSLSCHWLISRNSRILVRWQFDNKMLQCARLL